MFFTCNLVIPLVKLFFWRGSKPWHHEMSILTVPGPRHWGQTHAPQLLLKSASDNMEKPHVDIYTCGFPCQTYSSFAANYLAFISQSHKLNWNWRQWLWWWHWLCWHWLLILTWLHFSDTDFKLYWLKKSPPTSTDLTCEQALVESIKVEETAEQECWRTSSGTSLRKSPGPLYWKMFQDWKERSTESWLDLI